MTAAGWHARFSSSALRSRWRTPPIASSVSRSSGRGPPLVDAELAPLRRERFQRERDIIEKLDLADGYNATFELLSGVSLAQLRAACERFSATRRRCGTRPTRSSSAASLKHRAAAKRRAPTRWRSSARASSTSSSRRPRWKRVVHRQVTEMGIDPHRGRPRPSRYRRARRKAVARVLRARPCPRRGVSGAAAPRRTDRLEHVSPRARARAAFRLHARRPSLRVPLARRQFGDRVVRDALRSPTCRTDAGSSGTRDLRETHARDFLRAAGFEELHFLRRYCAKFIYETQLYGGQVPWQSLPDLYVELLTAATSFRYVSADAFVDVDPRYYSARYLRAWQLQALMSETLTERFDEDWWRNPRTGPWMVESLFGEAQRELADELATRISGRELSFAPLIREIEKLLG